MDVSSMTVIAASGELILFERPRQDGSGWRSLKLVKTGPGGKKRNWWFGWNGARLSRSHDAEVLREHQPEAYRWVVEALQNKGTASDGRSP